jgi:hypothetical protein
MKNDGFVKEYVRSLSDDDLRFVGSRLQQNLCGDLCEVLNFLSRTKELDRYLAGAEDYSEFFRSIEYIAECVDRSIGAG